VIGLARVFLPAQLVKLTGGAREVEARGTTLLEVIEALEAAYPGIRDRLIEGDRMRPGLAAAVDNVLSGLRQPVGESSEVCFIPAMQGG
jgi:molybdopterin synthase sulfur carrier subunit